MKKIRVLVIILLLVLTIINPIQIVISEQKYQISGIVRNKNSVRMQNIKIELMSGEKVIASDYTNLVGYYRIVKALEEKTKYILRVSDERIQTYIITFETNQSEVSIDIVVNSNPIAVLDYQEMGYVNGELLFSASDSYDPDNDPLSLLWDFGDGGSSQSEAPTHVYSTPGDYIITLQVTDTYGAKDSISDKIEIKNHSPVAMINGPYTARVGHTLQFNSEGSYDPDNDILTYFWDFGDNTNSEQPNPQHVYSEVKEYQVKLSIYDRHGAKDEVDTKCIVLEYLNPVANANGPYSGYVGIPIQFSSEGSIDPDGTIQSYIWEFEDGTQSDVSHPELIFSEVGEYSFTLSVTDNEGHSDVDSSIIKVLTPSKLPPIAKSNGPYTGYINRMIVFSSQGSYDPDESSLEFLWEFGDGGTSTDANPRYGYLVQGIYEVTLTVTDADLQIGIDTAICTVRKPSTTSPSPSPSPVNQNPVAIGTFTKRGEIGKLIQFSSEESYDPDGIITKYRWDFGDGDTSKDKKPNHSYSKTGDYYVTLTVTDNNGKKASDSHFLTIYKTNIPPIVVLDETIQAKTNEIIQFSTMDCYDTDGEIVDYKWNFGDNFNSSLENPQHSYSDSGDYIVELRVTDNLNSSTSAFSSITITDNKPPVPIITSTNQTKIGEAIEFSALSSYDADGEIVEYVWDFGDGLSSNLAEINYIYHEVGEKTVKLIVIDNDMTKNRIRKTIEVLPNHTPKISVNKSRKGVVFDEMSFVSESIDIDGEIVSTLWNFGDGGYAEGIKVYYNYTSPGIYSGSITVTDDNYESSIEDIEIIIIDPKSETIIPFLTISVSIIMGIAYVFHKPWLKLIGNL